MKSPNIHTDGGMMITFSRSQSRRVAQATSTVIRTNCPMWGANPGDTISSHALDGPTSNAKPRPSNGSRRLAATRATPPSAPTRTMSGALQPEAPGPDLQQQGLPRRDCGAGSH